MLENTVQGGGATPRIFVKLVEKTVSLPGKFGHVCKCVWIYITVASKDTRWVSERLNRLPSPQLKDGQGVALHEAKAPGLWFITHYELYLYFAHIFHHYM